MKGHIWLCSFSPIITAICDKQESYWSLYNWCTKLYWLRNCTPINYHCLLHLAEGKRWMWLTTIFQRLARLITIYCTHKADVPKTWTKHGLWVVCYTWPPFDASFLSRTSYSTQFVQVSIRASGMWYYDISLYQSFLPLRMSAISKSGLYLIQFLFLYCLVQSLEMGRKHKYMINWQNNKYAKLLELEYVDGGFRSSFYLLVVTVLRKFLNLCESQLQKGNYNAKLSYFSVIGRLKINLKRCIWKCFGNQKMERPPVLY